MNKKIIFLTFIIIIFLIGSLTTYKVIKKHQDNMLLVSKKYIEEKAKECYLDQKCSSNKITLEELYQNSYLAKQANPITKEYYPENSYVEIKDGNYIFVITN